MHICTYTHIYIYIWTYTISDDLLIQNTREGDNQKTAHEMQLDHLRVLRFINLLTMESCHHYGLGKLLWSYYMIIHLPPIFSRMNVFSLQQLWKNSIKGIKKVSQSFIFHVHRFFSFSSPRLPINVPRPFNFSTSPIVFIRQFDG